MGKGNKSILLKLRDTLKGKIASGADINYSVPDLWNCFGYETMEENRDSSVINVNPYEFYYNCIQNYILKDSKPNIDYHKSLSIITKNYKVKYGYLGGDWIKKSSIYAMHIRTSTSFDHDGSGNLEECNKNGLKETGTFVKTIALIPLLKKIGVDTIYLLPISKISTKCKKGELGSPYAVKNFFKIDPELKDPMTEDELTIEEEFAALVEACHIMGIRVMIDLIPRTAARDNDLLMEHPDWFYWVRTKDLDDYGPPYVEGVAPAEKPSFNNIEQIYKSPYVWNLIRKFTQSPDKIDKLKWGEIKEKYNKDSNIDFLNEIEMKFGITTAPAYSDCINDPQPPWTDVTYLRLFLDNPVPSQRFIGEEKLNPYILFDTIKGNIFKGAVRNEELWDTLSNIIPYYQEHFGIDGARIDMGHALPEELVQMILDKPREKDYDFAFVAEELLVSEAESARKNGYNMIIGYGWWLEPRIYEHKTHEFMYNTREIKAPVFACAETPDTPRVASRDGGRVLSKLLTVLNQFLPNAVPLISSGLEIYETQPMNTGLDCRADERFRLPKDDPFYGKLAFFDKYAFHWTNPQRWDMVDTLETIRNIKDTFFSTIKNPDNYIPVPFEDPKDMAIGIAYAIEGKRWTGYDNVLLIVGNGDVYNEKEYVAHLQNIREFAGNASRKAYLMYSNNEWNHDIYDFDDNWNIHLKFKPGEIKILIM